MGLTFTQLAVLLGAVILAAFTLYSENITVFFRQKGITRMVSKDAQKNVTIYDPDSGKHYIPVSRQFVEGKIHLCELYPIGEKHHPARFDIDFSMLRGNALELFDTGKVTLIITRPENISTVFEADNNVFDLPPAVLYNKLHMLETDKIRLEAEITTLKAQQYIGVQDVIETVKSLEQAKGIGKGGFTK